MSVDPSALLPEAHAIVRDLLARLQTLAEEAQRYDTQTTQDLRQVSRMLDEITAQHQFAAQHHMPTAAALAERERHIRAEYQTLDQQSRASRRALKQLDQLIRQIDMSSTTLRGDSENDVPDPWMLALRSQVILGREEERVRLAREVHDGPAQVLANSLMVARQSRVMLQEQRIDQLGLMLERLCDATSEGLHEVRRFIADLRPGGITEQGLVNTLHEYVTRYRDTLGVDARFEADPLPRLSTESEIVLYRITQEALQNVYKHAPNATVICAVGVRQDHLVLTIRDDGPGFDTHSVAKRTGRESWGLTSMRERAELIGARLVIASRPGQGTEVAVSLPLLSG